MTNDSQDSDEFLRLIGKYIIDEVDTQDLLSVIKFDLATPSSSETPDSPTQLAASLVVEDEPRLDVV